MLKKLPYALEALAEYDQFILWFPTPRAGTDKHDKFPVNVHTGRVADAHDPAVWLSLADAECAAEAYGPQYGLGYVFTERDPFFFLDIDECLVGGDWSESAKWLMTQLPGAAVEVSYSGRGLHIFGKADPIEHGIKNSALGADLYTSKRFAALTGTNVVGSAGLNFTPHIAGPVASQFPPGPTTGVVLDDWTTAPVAEYRGFDDDQIIIDKALKSKSAGSVFGGKCSFKDIWTANEDELAKAYPHPEGLKPFDNSVVDAALAQHLAFWTGKNCERIESLMRQSALVRDKWDRDDYVQGTILKAVAICREVYKGGPLEELAAPNGADVVTVDSYQYMPTDLQLKHFKGCVYVQDIHRVFTPTGALLKSEQFNASFGGYVFQLDALGNTDTRKAWEAFTESQVIRRPWVESRCFRPELPPGEVVKEEGRTLVNTYLPIETPRQVGDVTPFLTHLGKLLPDPHDQTVLLSYLAACVQHKGVKFQWAPLLQGAEGNGKTLFTRCVMFAIGQKYSHMPLPNELGEKFNAWLFEKLFIGIEDIYIPKQKLEIMEILKPMITNDYHARRGMKQDQVMMDNRANFVLNSNHKDAVRKTRNDRRFSIFYTAQQSAEDMARDGMDSGYFPALYDWLKRGGGFAMVSEYLHTYQIPAEFNPATECHRAPITSTTNDAVAMGLGAVEQEIIEAIEEGRTGFRGGWVSSVAVERLMTGMKPSRNIAHNKRREVLQSIGYDWHPALKNGRVNNPIMLDEGKKPRLFIQNNHIHCNLTSPAEVSRLYVEAQSARAPLGGQNAATIG